MKNPGPYLSLPIRLSWEQAKQLEALAQDRNLTMNQTGKALFTEALEQETRKLQKKT